MFGVMCVLVTGLCALYMSVDLIFSTRTQYVKYNVQILNLFRPQVAEPFFTSCFSFFKVFFIGVQYMYFS